MKTKTSYYSLIIIQLFLIICAGNSLDAQSRKERDSLNITEKKFIEVDYLDSNGEELLERIERYDENGRMIEEIEYDNSEKIKKHIRYEYENDLLMKEIHLDHKERIERTEVYEYDEDGLKISKKYFDAKNRIYKEKRYQYQK
jgi:hypothetical protein